MSEIVHVIPIDDLREHCSEGIHCDCRPKVEHVENDGVVVIHNSWDGREITERALDHAFNAGQN